MSTAADDPPRTGRSSPYSMWRSQHRTDQLMAPADQARFVELLSHVGCHVYSGELLPDGQYVESYTGPGSDQFLGYLPDDDVDPTQAWYDAIHPDDRWVYDAQGDFDPSGVMVLEYRMVGRDGKTRWVLDQMWEREVRDDGRRVVDGVVTDITRRKAAELELVRQAHSDSLTGLANRLDLLEHVARAGHRLTVARRTTGQSTDPPPGVGLMLLDLDGFKAVNDSFGHAVGDELLVAVAGRINSCIRPGDVAARLGGDEFAVLADRVTRDEAWFVAARIRDALARPFAVGDRRLPLSASIGLVHTGKIGVERDLLRDADVAMYRAKAEGRNRVVLFEPEMQERVARKALLAAEIRRGLADDEFFLHYQPVVDLGTGDAVGMEALVRWRHPERGLLTPAEFIELAEQTGLIVPLGRWVLEQACRDAVAWQPADGSPVGVSVNISPRQLYDSDLLTDVDAALRAAGLPAQALTVEITENLLLVDTRIAAARLAELRALGVRVAIDDFGTGYSSLAYLDRYPVDVMKIDRSFVKPLDGSPRSVAMIRSMVELAQALGIEPVAEGVESVEQADLLSQLGCQFGQGFYFARPAPLGPDGPAPAQIGTSMPAGRSSQVKPPSPRESISSDSTEASASRRR